MKVFKKIYTIFAASACAFLLLNGCSAITNGLSSAEAADFSVLGEISCSGASSRAATSALKDDITWKISAKKSDGSESVEPVTAKNMTFTLNLPSAGKWKIFASGFSGETQILSGEKEVSVDVKGLTGINIAVAVSLDFSKLADFDAVTGNVELPVTDKTGKIAKVSGNLTYVLYDVEPVEEDSGEEVSEEYYEKLEELMKPKSFSATFSNGTASIKLSDLTPGLYDAKIQFLDSAGNALYSCMEQFTVYSGFTTDTWYGTAPYLSDGKFELTSALLGTFASYIVPSTKTVLYNTYEKSIDGSNKTVYSLSFGGADFYTDNQLNNFEFDKNGNLYAFVVSDENTWIKSSRNSFTPFESPMSYPNSCEFHLAIDREKDLLWLFMEQEHSLYCYNDISTKNDFSEGTSLSYTSGNVFYNGEFTYSPTAMAANNGYLYFAKAEYNYSTGQQIINLTITDVTSDVNDDDPHNIILECHNTKVLDTELSSGSSNVNIVDILYQDYCVYFLLKESNFAFGNGENNFALSSRGAVVRYNTLTEKVDSTGWTDASNGTEFNYGNKAKANEKFWPTNSYGKIYYNDMIYENGYGSLESVNHPVSIKAASEFTTQGSGTVTAYTPLLASLDNQFIGPQKFVALKPKKLVIADSGIAFYTDAEGVWKYKNINRLVTVDLDSFIFTDTEDLNSSVSFTTKRTNALRLQASAFEASILLDSNAGDREFCYSNGAGSYYGLSNPVYVYASIVSDEE